MSVDIEFDVLADGNDKVVTITKATGGGNNLTVIFDANGGKAVPSVNVASGAKLTAPSGCTKTGYTLEGWYYNGTKWDFSTSTVTNSMTLEAAWTKSA